MVNMNPIQYIIFYYKLTEKKIIYVICLALLSSFFQIFALSAIAAVSSYGSNPPPTDTISKIIFQFIHILRIPEGQATLAFLLFIVSFAYMLMSLFLFFT